MAKFLLYTTVGSAIWNTVLIVIGNRVGENWESILGVFDQYSHIVLILLILIFVLFIVWFYTKKKEKESIKKNNLTTVRLFFCERKCIRRDF